MALSAPTRPLRLPRADRLAGKLPHHGTVIQLGAGTYDISQDIGDEDFPDGPTDISITGPGSRVLVRAVPQVLAPDDPAAVFLGAWDCYRS